MKDTESVSPGGHVSTLRAASRIALGSTGRTSSPYNSVHNLTSERLRVLRVVDNGAVGGGREGGGGGREGGGGGREGGGGGREGGGGGRGGGGGGRESGQGGGGRTFVNVHHVRSLALASYSVILAIACKVGSIRI
jgi:hypothetical protein